MTPDLICLGEPLIEFVGRGPDDPTFLCGLGGDTSNAAIAAARQGARVGYLTALGADRFGDRVMSHWHEEGIDTSQVLRNPDAPTGIYFVDPDPAGRFFTYYRKGSAAACLSADDLPIDYIRGARALHLSGITLAISALMRGAALAASSAAKAAGVSVSLDTNLRLGLWPVDEAQTVIHDAMRHADIAITSIDDSAHLTGLTDPDAIIAFYQSLGPRIVIVTMGAEGCRLGVGRDRHSIAAAPCTPVDSTGAGDSFAGSFLARWMAIGDPVAAARYAAIVAAHVVSGYGAVASIPTAETVLAAL